MVTLNLSHFIDNREGKKTKFALEKCPDKGAFLEMSISSNLVSTVTGSDTMSMMSGMDNFDSMSIDSGPDSEFNFQQLEQNEEEEKKSKDVENTDVAIDSKKMMIRKRIISSIGKRTQNQQPTIKTIQEEKAEDEENDADDDARSVNSIIETG